jgi:hypothetical protein
MQGLFWATVFQNITGNFSLPDDPESTYTFSATGAVTRTITLPRLIGNTAFGGQTGLTAAQVTQGVLNGLWLEILNASTVAANLLQAAAAAGDGGGNIGGTIAIGTATTTTMGQYQVINGTWFKIL